MQDKKKRQGSKPIFYGSLTIMNSNHDIDLNAKFRLALAAMDENDHLFITGKAGTGKSTLLSLFSRQTYQKTKKSPPLLAPTGVAALNIRGRTIHSFFGFSADITVEKILRKDNPPKQPDLYKKLTQIIIDEASMLRADLVDCIDTFLRLYGKNKQKAFGGVQIVFIGDLYQLPPVVLRNEQEIFQTHYKGPYFFAAHVFQKKEKISLKVIELDKVYRQKNLDFIKLLNRIRLNTITKQDLDTLASLYKENFRPRNYKPKSNNQIDRYIHLTTTNQMASKINEERLAALSGKLHGFEGIVSGSFGQEYYPTNKYLKVKENAQVMFLNNDSRRRWVNGSLGTIEEINVAENFLVIGLHDLSKSVKVEPFVWELYEYKTNGNEILTESIGSFSQFPIRLAWAITIHKSQGKTFDRVILDIGWGTFAAGQIYVGLSRARSLKSIVLKKPIRKEHIIVDPRITTFLQNNPSIT